LLLIALAALWLSTWAVSEHLTEQQDESAQVDELRAAARVLVPRYRAALEAGAGREILAARMAEDAQLLRARITLIGPDGGVAADAGAEFDPSSVLGTADGAAESRAQASIERAAVTGESVAVHRVKQQGEDAKSYCLAQALRPGVGRAEVVLLRVIRPAPDAANSTVSVFGAIGSVLLAGAAFLIVGNRLNRSITRIAWSVRRASSGELDHRIGTPPLADLQRLTESLNESLGAFAEEIRRLRVQHGEQQAILQSLEGGVIALDTEHRVLSINRVAGQMLGVEPERAKGRLLEELTREPDLNRFVEEALTRGATSAEFRLRSGAQQEVRASAGSLRGADGESAGLIVLLTDVTHIKRLETVRTDFAANVSHELRTPITSIKGYVDTLLEADAYDPEKSRRFLLIIQRNAERLHAIVNDLLTLTDLERPDIRESLIMTETDAAAIAATACSQLALEADARRIRVEMEGEHGIPVRANRVLAEQALENLLSNAIKYSPQGSRVLVRWRESGGDPPGFVSFEVIDEGPGISREHLGRVFERFYRVDRSRSRHEGGTGLGLAIVKHIARAHGGEVSVQSEVGAGSCFRLDLPRGSGNSPHRAGGEAGREEP